MKRISRISVGLVIFFLMLGCAALTAQGDYYAGAKVTVIKKATVAADGRKMEYPKTENPEVTALLVEIPPDGETGWHFHPVPVYAYVLSGGLRVEMEGGQVRDYKEGDAIFEVLNTPHNGKNLGEVPAKLIVFYTGEEGKPVTIRTNPNIRP